MIHIEKDPRIEQWLSLKEASKSTTKTYLCYMGAFCECVGKTPSELMTEAIEEIKDGKLLSERNTVIYMSKYKKYLSEKSSNTQGVALSTVYSFYKTFDIEISALANKRKKKMPLRENQNFLNKDDVKNLIVNAKNLRMKAILLFMATSGMARNEILNLRMKDITFDDNNIGIINIRRQKAQVDYTTFISPEAVIALRAYLDERNRDEYLKVKGQNDFIFVTYGEKLRKGETKGKSIGGKISPATFVNEFKTQGEGLGYGNEGYMIKSRSHALRKFFASTLENAGMPKNKIDFMLGHTQNSTDMAYFHTDVNKLKELYIKYLPYLIFEKTIEIRSLNSDDAKELSKLKKENLDLNAKFTNINNEMASVKKALEGYKQLASILAHADRTVTKDGRIILEMKGLRDDS